MLASRYQKGFTLIELMIVIGIIALLAGVMVPNFARARAEANLSACEENLKNISTALEMYIVRHSGYPNDLQALIDGHYLKMIPTCPASGDGYTLTVSTDGKQYTLVCGTGSTASHSGCDVSAGFPKYTSGSGLLEH